MSTQAKLQSDPFEYLKAILGDTLLDHEFLARYVVYLELHRQEEDVFIRFVFENANAGGAFPSRGGSFIVSVYSELYEPLDAEHKLEIRRWWHKKVRGEADQFDDLKTRQSKIA